jgi:polyphosphate kinase 2 (PPK2 family)
MAIFDGSWYRRVLLESMETELSEVDYQRAFTDIRSLERTLSDDRYLIVKFFLHIDKKTQRKRMKKLQSDPLTEWRVKESDWRQHRRYDEYVVAIERMIQLTDAGLAPWVIVEASNQRWARVKVLESFIERLLKGLQTLEKGDGSAGQNA